MKNLRISYIKKDVSRQGARKQALNERNASLGRNACNSPLRPPIQKDCKASSHSASAHLGGTKPLKIARGCLLVFFGVCCMIGFIVPFDDENLFMDDMVYSSEQELIAGVSTNKYGPEVWTSRAIEKAQARGLYNLAFILKQNRHMHGLGRCEEYYITSVEGDIGNEEVSFPSVSVLENTIDHTMVVLRYLKIVVIVIFVLYVTGWMRKFRCTKFLLDFFEKI